LQEVQKETEESERLLEQSRALKEQMFEEVTKVSPSARLVLQNEAHGSRGHRTPQTQKEHTPVESPSPKQEVKVSDYDE